MIIYTNLKRNFLLDRITNNVILILGLNTIYSAVRFY
jgi:hypothetical protein